MFWFFLFGGDALLLFLCVFFYRTLARYIRYFLMRFLDLGNLASYMAVLNVFIFLLLFVLFLFVLPVIINVICVVLVLGDQHY